MKKIIGIDPGTLESAFVVWDVSKAHALGKVPNDQILDVIRAYDDVEHVVIEAIVSYGMAVGQTTFDTCVWIGRFQQLAEELSISNSLLRRKAVCLHICNNGSAKDPNIRMALIDRYGKPSLKNKPNLVYNDHWKDNKMAKDMWSALAISVTYWETELTTNR